MIQHQSVHQKLVQFCDEKYLAKLNQRYHQKIFEMMMQFFVVAFQTLQMHYLKNQVHSEFLADAIQVLKVRLLCLVEE